MTNSLTTALVKGTVGRGGDNVLPILVPGSDGGSDGLRVVEDGLGGGKRVTRMQKNYETAFDRRNSPCLDNDNKWSDGEQGGFGEYGYTGNGVSGETLWN